ncbi:unnamed protein product [Schistosoma spindalis]|nr:unnamed protein product [Schistosoma spindale]
MREFQVSAGRCGNDSDKSRQKQSLHSTISISNNTAQETFSLLFKLYESVIHLKLFLVQNASKITSFDKSVFISSR